MKRVLPALFAVALTIPFWNLGHPLWEVDDARYAEVPREMHESGDWLTPSLNYVDYIEKPPMIYWLGAMSYHLFGVSEAASRLPLALLAVLGMLGVWWLGTWLYSPRIGLYAGLLLGTCAQFTALAHLTTPDMAVSVFLLWATGLILRCLRCPEDRWSGTLAWLAMAAAFLSKGLIAVVFPAAWTLLLLFFFPKMRSRLRRLLLNWGTGAFCLIIGIWFLAMERANPGFFKVFIIEQHFQRFLDTQKYNRPGPWYFFFGVNVVGTLPWTPLLVPAALLPLLRWRHTDARDRQLVLWFWLIFIFFSISSSKLITYILPLFAHQALLGARLAARLSADVRANRWVMRPAVMLCALFIAAAGIAPILLPHLKLPLDLPTGLLAVGTALLLVLAASQYALAHFGRRGETKRLMIFGTLSALAVTGFLISGTSYLDDEISVRRMGTELRARIEHQRGGKEARIFAYNKYLHGIPFYTGRPVDVVNWIGELHYAKRFKRFAHRFGNDDTIRGLPSPGQSAFVTVQRRDLEHFMNVAPHRAIRGRTDYGPWILFEF
ncbi:MAG: glycosyltransferase family 39 protein [Elusimicrobiota bacterium]